MDNSIIISQLEVNLKDQGFSMTTCPIERLYDLKQDFEGPLKNGLISSSFFQERLSNFKLSPLDYREGLKSIIVTAAPQLPQMTIYQYQGKEHRCIVPPTYTDQTDKIIEKIIIDIIGSYNFSIFPALIPVKITAVRTGLTKYGRNNITYCNSMGSYFRLKAFMTDLPVDENMWHEFELMPQCNNCQACLRSCPTSAIRADRILLQADKCLTYFNEKMEEFPIWIKKSWHNSLIGCMRCQIVCPVNKKLNLHTDNAVKFSEEETEKLLNARDGQALPDSVLTKLRRLSLSEDWQLVARNLSVLLAQISGI
jgi:epoxyqueuosine reductase